MKDHLTIGEAAKQLGLAVDTVRRLANDGKLKATLTPGGHRRFTRRTLDSYRTREQASPRRARPAHTPRKGVTPLPPRRPQPAFDEDDFPDNFDDTPDDSWETPDEPEPPPARPARPAPSSFTPPPLVWPTPVKEEAMPVAKNAADEAKRLANLKTHGLSAIPYDAPPTLRGKVIADLERFVNAEKLPEWVSAWEAQRIVTGRVEEVLKPWREESAAQQKLQELIADGNHYAHMQTTSDWDYAIAQEARQEVERVLKKKVETDWTQSKVRALVDDILAEWDDDEDDEDEEDDDDDDDD